VFKAINDANSNSILFYGNCFIVDTVQLIFKDFHCWESQLLYFNPMSVPRPQTVYGRRHSSGTCSEIGCYCWLTQKNTKRRSAVWPVRFYEIVIGLLSIAKRAYKTDSTQRPSLAHLWDQFLHNIPGLFDLFYPL
jgi:hypothetical protein